MLLFFFYGKFLSHKGATVFEASKTRPGDKRKKQRNMDPADIDGYLGPWGKYVDEKTVIKPSEVLLVYKSCSLE